MKKQILILMLIVIGLAFVFAACNVPAAEDNTSAKQTSVAQTVAAALPTNTPPPTNTPEGAAPSPTSETTAGETQSAATATTSAGDNTTSGDDKAKFVSDITIPDYSEYDAGEEITKTWRVQNVGTSTWTTDYTLVFMSGEKLGAADSVTLPFNVEPDAFLDISVDFTVPTAGGEYRSDWIFLNANGEEFGTGPEFDQSIYMIIVSNGDGTDSSGGGDNNNNDDSIAGGAKITNATVTVDDANYSGSCPANITFTYTVTAAEAGKVNFRLVLNAVSPAGYSIDPPPEYPVDFASGYTVTYSYTFLPSSSMTGTAKVQAVGANTYTSDAINFSVNCD